MNTQTTHTKTEKQLIPHLRFKEFDYSWFEIKLNEIVKVMTDYVASGSFESLRNNVEVYDEPNYAVYVRLTDLRHSLKHKALKYVDKNSYEFLTKSNLYGGELLVANIGANVGDVYMMPYNFGKATIAPNMVVIRENKDKFISNFLFYVFNSYSGKKAINKAISGSGQPKLSKTDFKKIKLKITQLPEQQKIASFLTAVDTKIQRLTQKKKLLQQYKKGVMQQLFSQQLRFKQSDGSNYPDWEEKKLGEVSYITTGSSNRVDSSLDGEFTFFDRSEDIRTSSIFLFDGEAIIVPGEGQKFIPKYFIGKFDLHQRTYAIMKFENCSGKYVYYYLAHHPNYLLSQAVGSTVKSLRLPMFKKMKIKFPCTEEQQQIASYLSALDTKIETVTQQIETNQQFKKGLLQQMFL